MMLRRVFYRSWTYLQAGYTYVSLPFTWIGLSSAIWLVVKDISLLGWLFPRYQFFLAAILSIGVPTTVMIGWWHYRRSRVYREQQDILVDSNPYSNWKMNKKERVGWEIQQEIIVSLVTLSRVLGVEVPLVGSAAVQEARRLLALNGVDVEELKKRGS